MTPIEQSINPAEENQPAKADMIPLEDDELDTVAGGAGAEKEASFAEAEARARAEGRTHNLPPANRTCVCHHKYKWARECRRVDTYLGVYPHSIEGLLVDTDYVFEDIKCYKCGKAWDKKTYQRDNL